MTYDEKYMRIALGLDKPTKYKFTGVLNLNGNLIAETSNNTTRYITGKDLQVHHVLRNAHYGRSMTLEVVFHTLPKFEKGSEMYSYEKMVGIKSLSFLNSDV